jgi:ribA/ribD-fused uncharacterized protein
VGLTSPSKPKPFKGELQSKYHKPIVQTAKENERITSFRGRYHFLSNFAELDQPLTIRGITYPTTEHAFQAAKTKDVATRKKIAAASTPGKAKRLGGRRGIIKDFDEREWFGGRDEEVMRYILEEKFKDPRLRQKLLNTGDAYLEEGNTWGDTKWGTVGGKGANKLGKLLMELRDRLRNQS